MVRDISDLLQEWEFDPDNQVRIVEAEDGRPLLQVREPLGVQQYELDGRPDGLMPDGCECMVELYREKLGTYRSANGTDEGFVLDREDCAKLHNEGIIYYYRYLVLFQIGDFARTAADTEHNLEICDLIGKYAESEEDKTEILQFRPYILRINAVANAMIKVNEEMISQATELLESAIQDIESMPDIDTPTFEMERNRSIDVLQSTLKQVLQAKASPVAELERELEDAVAEENYELAAELRDKIRSLDRAEHA
jgi:hypothetical protein